MRWLATKFLRIDQHTALTYAEIRANLFRIYAPRNRRGRLTQKYVEDLTDRTTGKQLGIQEKRSMDNERRRPVQLNPCNKRQNAQSSRGSNVL